MSSMRKIEVIACLIALHLADVGVAHADNQGLAIAGIGSSSCEHFLSIPSERADIDFAFFSWAQGLLSGLNMEYIAGDGESTDLTDNKYQSAWLRQYCAENRSHSYFTAVMNLWRELRQEQGLTDVD